VSVACFGDPESPLLRFLGTPPEDCSWCGRPLTDPVVLVSRRHPRGVPSRLRRGLWGTLIFEVRRAKMVSEGQSLLGGLDRRWRALAASEPQ
jgi:hypothetical protein